MVVKEWKGGLLQYARSYLSSAKVTHDGVFSFFLGGRVLKRRDNPMVQTSIRSFEPQPLAESKQRPQDSDSITSSDVLL